jgi:hypothetical protein
MTRLRKVPRYAPRTSATRYRRVAIGTTPGSHSQRSPAIRTMQALRGYRGRRTLTTLLDRDFARAFVNQSSTLQANNRIRHYGQYATTRSPRKTRFSLDAPSFEHRLLPKVSAASGIPTTRLPPLASSIERIFMFRRPSSANAESTPRFPDARNSTSRL